MTNQHSVTISSDLIEQLESDIDRYEISTSQALARAYAAGADHELEACYQEVQKLYGVGSWLRSLRRPKPPSDKELALAALDDAILRGDCITTSDSLPIIRRALESLPD